MRVPVTQGGNAVIAAYAVDGATILWSWHLWITDYVPARLSGTITAANREEAIRTAKSASAGGTVHTYAGDAWTDATSGAFFGKVIMDRNLGALRNTCLRQTLGTAPCLRQYLFNGVVKTRCRLRRWRKG